MPTAAFKEWAAVVEALGAGRQTAILRKGGLVEEGGAFGVRDRRFALYPTTYHPDPSQLLREAHRWIVTSPTPAAIRFVAVVEETRRVGDLETLRRLAPYHVWTDAVVAERFARGGDAGLHVIVPRVLRLPTPVPLAPRPEYGGCTSWISIVEPIPFDAATPVLDDAAFERRRREIVAVLDGAPVA